MLMVTWIVAIYHMGVYPRSTEPPRQGAFHQGIWVDKSVHGTHHLILEGSAYMRGLESGRLTQHLLRRHESELYAKFQEIIPYDLLRRALIVASMRLFYGVDKYLETWMTDEMNGVSQHASHDFDFLADGLTRQVGYHGLHEVGQMMMDQGGEDMGCTVAAAPLKNSWLIGRNFDFEGGRSFDTEKIIKWVFPDEGNAYVSVVWAGMVGAVTGVNEHGLYISLNAAGSDDRRIHGTPSTLVLLKALQFAKSADEAIQILRTENMFITDIFVVLDSKRSQLYRIEKSPYRMAVIPLREPAIITNHLLSDVWRDDSVNKFRMNELTTVARQQRGEALLKNPLNDEHDMLQVLRDKGIEDGVPFHLGNRRAIDALIAAHAVIFNGVSNTLYVSSGPSVSGPFVGYDLAASFRTHRPVVKGHLRADPMVSDSTYDLVHRVERISHRARRLARSGRCVQAQSLMDQVNAAHTVHSAYFHALGDMLHCFGEELEAQTAWSRSLDLYPPYASEIAELKAALKL